MLARVLASSQYIEAREYASRSDYSSSLGPITTWVKWEWTCEAILCNVRFVAVLLHTTGWQTALQPSSHISIGQNAKTWFRSCEVPGHHARELVDRYCISR
jgi:hypothetical protein